MARNYIRDSRGRFSSRGGGGAVGRARARHSAKSASIQEVAARNTPSSEFRVARGRPWGGAKAAGMTASQTMQAGASKPTVIRSRRVGGVERFKLGSGRRGAAVIDGGKRFYTKAEGVKRGAHPLMGGSDARRTAGLVVAKSSGKSRRRR